MEKYVPCLESWEPRAGKAAETGLERGHRQASIQADGGRPVERRAKDFSSSILLPAVAGARRRRWW